MSRIVYVVACSWPTLPAQSSPLLILPLLQATPPHSPHIPPPCSTLRLWDPRAAPGSGPMARLPLPGQAYSMSASGQRLVVGCSGRHVDIYDLRT